MSKKVDGSPNWSLSSLQAPPALHICVTDLHTQPGVAERFLKDLASAADKLMKSPSNGSTGMVRETYPSVSRVSSPLTSYFSDVLGCNLWNVREDSRSFSCCFCRIQFFGRLLCNGSSTASDEGLAEARVYFRFAKLTVFIIVLWSLIRPIICLDITKLTFF